MILIGEFSKLVNVPIKTLRYWDNTGKLKAHRTMGGSRYYDQYHFDVIEKNKEKGDKEKNE